MLTVLSANGPSGYSIANSLRFRSSASAYLNRTPASASNRTTWTWSAWVKLGALQSETLFGSGTSASNYEQIGFSSNTLFYYSTISGVGNAYVYTNALFRDPSAWYHVVCVFNTGNATAANRILFYVNGVLQTTTVNTAASLNFTSLINSTTATYVGATNTGSVTAFFDGYLADINFIDGQALTPSSFGAFNATTGVWGPKSYTGTYGTNGFKLNFSNGTSTTTLGYDSSGNGNNWTTNNISLTAGSTYDWMIDSPTKFPWSSYGVGNYAVLNPLDAGSASLVNANLTASQGTAWATGLSTIHPTSGKWYFEITAGAATVYSGIATQSFVFSGNNLGAAAAYGYYGSNGNFYDNGSTSTSLSTYGAGDVIGVALDIDNGKLWFAKNGTWQASGDPASGTNPIKSGLSASYWQLGTSAYNTTSNANFGQRPFAYTPPSGYKSLCTQNLPGVTIQNGAQYMAATLFTETGSAQTINNAVNGVSFQPDLVWQKARSEVASHRLIDSVRGTGKVIYSNLTNVEATESGVVDSFTSTGYVGAGPAVVATTGGTGVAWQWKAGGTAVTNTAGSITSSVSANTTAGFSVVTATNIPVSAATQTIGHGLGVAPSFFILKNRNLVDDWYCYHTSLGYTKYITLDTTAAAVNSAVWVTNPTSTVLSTIGNAFITSTSQSLVIYCFAAIPGYSAFGSYTGNGSADGPFVYCGFRPAFVLIKGSSFVSNWFIEDQARNGYNVNDGVALRPNLSSAEDGTTTYNLDLLSNGFKLRSSAGDSNTNGATFIWAAFASNPFQNALAR